MSTIFDCGWNGERCMRLYCKKSGPCQEYEAEVVSGEENMIASDAEFRKILAGYTDLTADVKALDARLDERRKINAIVTAYMRALDDPQFKCPSYLMASIEAARG